MAQPQWVVQKFLSTFKFYDQRLVDKGAVSFVDIGRDLVTNPSGIIDTITTALERYMPERVCIDPITPIRDILHWRGETREFMHDLFARRKFLEVVKMRGTKHTTGRQLLEISQEGLTVQPGLR